MQFLPYEAYYDYWKTRFSFLRCEQMVFAATFTGEQSVKRSLNKTPLDVCNG